MGVTLILLAIFVGDRSARPDSPVAVDFANEIAPLLQTRCLDCHADEDAGGTMRMASRDTLLQGGASGPAIEVGASQRSLLIRRVLAPANSDLRMPPEGPPLTARQVATLAQWIDSGADWPAGLVLRTARAAAQEHWAFQPIQRFAPPCRTLGDRSEDAIDAFVQVRLAAEGLRPAPAADRFTLLRRVTLDLIGLPPSQEEVEQFLSDRRPDAYERVVDRLLASPHYGERWARPWLDLCHYADTDGYLTDQARPVAWRYRQWLIDALNDDLPCDQFTIQQLAGDLLPQATVKERLATGFLRNTLSNREGGADLEEFRVEQVIDRTTLVGVGWLGLTVGCARCHDHKYDPLSQKEFYRLYACLDQADEVNIDAPLPGDNPDFAAQHARRRQQREALIAPVKDQLEALQAQWEEKLLTAAENPGQDAIFDRQWEVLGLIWGGQFGEGQLEGCEIVQTPWEQRSQHERDRLLEYFLERGALIDGAKFSELNLDHLLQRIKELKATVSWPTRAPTMRAARRPRAVHVHLRGDFRTPGELVTPGSWPWLKPLVLDGAGETTAAAFSGNAARLELARWLIDARHPLTARVLANRLWLELFGRGLVDPPDDFGLRGNPPSHPELLDWLASEIIRRRWSIKDMHRSLVTSATYRQASLARADLHDRDPQNRLLARQMPLRFSADQVRDAALAVSGLLERRVGGPSVFPPQPESVAKEGFSNVWTASEGADRYRRGLYTWLQRLSPYAQKVTFDAPHPNSICTHRERTNSPLQALTLLNDPVFFEAAQALARRTLRSAAQNDEQRVAFVVQCVLSRHPSPHEMGVLHSLLKDQRKLLRTEQPEFAKRVAEFATAPSDDGELAAWTSVTSVVLNLHEFITRD